MRPPPAAVALVLATQALAGCSARVPTGAADVPAVDVARDVDPGDAAATEVGLDAATRDAAQGSDAVRTGDAVAVTTPIHHLPTPTPCATPRPGSCPAGRLGGSCATDADCAATHGANGHCDGFAAPNGGVGCACIFPCLCDGDCGEGRFCTRVDRCGVHGSYCHTSRDECVNDSDCPAGSYGCTFFFDRWLCDLSCD